jgi:acetylornithine deacetylase
MDMCPIGAGALSFRLHVRGRSAHGAMRAEGVSAVSKFFILNDAIQELERERHAAFTHPLFPCGQLAAPISIGRVQAGDWPSTVPETLIAEGRYGVLPGEDVAAARVQFEAAIRRACKSDAWLLEHPAGVEWFEGQFEPGETPDGAPILRTIHDAHSTVCGRSPSMHGVPYGSDLRLFTRHAGMHAVLYGPGDIRVAHSLNEYVPLSEVSKTAEVVALALVDWCRVT